MSSQFQDAPYWVTTRARWWIWWLFRAPAIVVILLFFLTYLLITSPYWAWVWLRMKWEEKGSDERKP